MRYFRGSNQPDAMFLVADVEKEKQGHVHTGGSMHGSENTGFQTVMIDKFTVTVKALSMVVTQKNHTHNQGSTMNW